MPNYSFVQINGLSGNTNFAFSFPYLSKAHIQVKVAAAVTTAYTWLNANTIVLNTPLVSAAVVEIRRITPVNVQTVVFSNGSNMTEADLNNSDLQNLYLDQEISDFEANAIQLDASGKFDAQSKVIENLATPSALTDAATKGYVDASYAVEGAHSVFAHNDVVLDVPVAGDLMAANISVPSKLQRFPIGTHLDMLEVDTTTTWKLKWRDLASKLFQMLTTKGDLMGSTGATTQRVAVGADATYLEANAASATGWRWTVPAWILKSVVTTVGDLLVATGSGVVARLGVGANGSVLAANSNIASGLQYVNVALGESFRGLSLRSHPGSDVANSKIMLVHADEIVTNDGWRCTPADRLVFDKSVTGSIGGMQAAAVNSTWNKLYYARKRSDGSEGLWGVRAKDYFLDQSFTTTTNDSSALRAGATNGVRLAQGIQLATAGKVEFVDVTLLKNNTPTGNYWFTLEADVAGSPSGTPLATSDKYDVSRLVAGSYLLVRVPFRTPATLSASTQYHLVLQADYTASATVNISWGGVTAGGYTGGSAKRFDGTTWAAAGPGDFNFKIYVTRNDTAISLPSGYDQYAQVGWAYINSGGNVNKFYQKDRRFLASRTSDWKIGQLANGVATLTDLSAFIPPAPVEVIMLGSDTAGTVYSSLGKLHATDITAATEVDGTSNAGHVFVGAQARPALPWPVINLEYQAMMQIAGSGTTHIWLSEFTW